MITRINGGGAPVGNNGGIVAANGVWRKLK